MPRPADVGHPRCGGRGDRPREFRGNVDHLVALDARGGRGGGVTRWPPAALAGVPGGGAGLSAAKTAALAEMQSAMSVVRDARRSGNFAQYGAALQRPDEAMGKVSSAKWLV